MSEPATGVSREDVIWCFTHIFGRTVEDDSTIDHFVSTEKDFRSLVSTFLSSHEYQTMYSRAILRGVDSDGFVYDDLLTSQDRVLRVLRNMQPKTVDGYRKIRVGNASDGGYVMLDDFEGVHAAYSLGINDDITWDKQIASYGIDIYQYDHTIDALPERNERFHWFKIGIAETPNGDLDTLPNLMSKNGHENTKELILKCDIEGHEWEMLGGMTPEQLGQFRQIVLETHGWGDLSRPDFADRIEKAIANLAVHHSLIHVHANNNAAYTIAGGVPLPAVLELTFVRRDRYRMSDSVELFPTALDAPCTNARADFYLGGFRF